MGKSHHPQQPQMAYNPQQQGYYAAPPPNGYPPQPYGYAPQQHMQPQQIIVEERRNDKRDDGPGCCAICWGVLCGFACFECCCCCC
ncbi:hypothetical protein NliqN6_4655 [Naganishia liquefaciens]|uniref:Cysteine-rich transmembrane CYSTM domain-containing protein n=1 Tax=Naganishia liquefaciens TaxID=104408 RepID=A0A8H3YGG0_9TREE|nr:hypothetical protein NliqN6_4655 [Naganishia liquefaciens]